MLISLRGIAVLFCFLINHSIDAQQLYITGTIVGDSDRVLSNAHVMLVNKKDSSLLTYTQSAASGAFRLSAGENKPYIVKISHIGYLTKNIAVNASTQRVIALDTIRLKQLDIQLMEVVVKTAKAALPEYILHLPKVIFFKLSLFG